MNCLPSQTKSHIPAKTSWTPIGLRHDPKEKIVISLPESVSRSPVVPPNRNPSKKAAAKKKRQPWLLNEDALLGSLLKKHQLDQPNWRQIAEELNRLLSTSRSGKQCRERWRNHLRPNIKKRGWTIAEEKEIRRMYQTFGPQWACMAKVLHDRTDNDIKNKWYSMYRSGKVQKISHWHEGKGRANKSIERAIAFSTPQNLNHSESPALDFPPPFSLAPIEARHVPNVVASAPSNEPNGALGQAICYLDPWAGVNF